MGCGSSEMFENAGAFTDDAINEKVFAALNVNPNKIRSGKERLLEYIYFLFLRKNYDIILQNIQVITKKEKISQGQSVALSDVTVLMSFLTTKLQELMQKEKQLQKERDIVEKKINQFQIKISKLNSQMIYQDMGKMGNGFTKKPNIEPPRYQVQPHLNEQEQHSNRALIKNVSLTRQEHYQSNLTRRIKNGESSKSQEIQMSNYTPTDIADSFAQPPNYYLPERAADLKAEIQDESQQNLDLQRIDFLKDCITGLQDQNKKLNSNYEALQKLNDKLKFQSEGLQKKINNMLEEKGSFTSTNDSKLARQEQKQIAEFKKKIQQLEFQLKSLAQQKTKRLDRFGIAKGDEITILNYKKTPAVESPSFIEVANPNEKEEVENVEDPHKKDRSISIMFNLFSNSKILPNHKDFQTAVGVRQILAEMFEEKVRSTELLYAYDQINPLHYEKYIKKAEDIMLLIKLPNDYIIGGFAGKLVCNQVEDSFIFSLNPHREPIKLTPSSKINRINRDSSYLSFGFDEISIKSKSLSVVCNVNGFRTMFSQKGRNVHIESFLGFEKRQFTAQAFEIYQINFKGNEDLKSVIF